MKDLEKYVDSIVESLLLCGKGLLLAEQANAKKSTKLINQMIEDQKQKILELAKAFEGE